MYKLVGLKSGKVYAEGHRSDCFRKLQRKYPTMKESELFINKGVQVTQIYPEPLKIIRRKK